jgi:hypothetical protein
MVTPADAAVVHAIKPLNAGFNQLATVFLQALKTAFPTQVL